MALAITKFTLRVNFFAFDDDGKQVSRAKTYEIESSGIDNATKRTNAQTEADALLAALVAITGAGIGSSALSEIQEDAVIAIPTDNLYKEAVIVFALNVTGSKKHSVYVPAPSAALLNADGDGVDISHASTQAFTDRFNSAGLTRLSDGEFTRTTNPILSSRVRSVASGSTY